MKGEKLRKTFLTSLPSATPSYVVSTSYSTNKTNVIESTTVKEVIDPARYEKITQPKLSRQRTRILNNEK